MGKKLVENVRIMLVQLVLIDFILPTDVYANFNLIEIMRHVYRPCFWRLRVMDHTQIMLDDFGFLWCWRWRASR